MTRGINSDAMQGFVEQLEVKNTRPSKRPLRTDLGQIRELMASVMEKGLLSPIIMRSSEGEGVFEVVAGSRRFEACTRIGMRKIPCHISELDDKEAYETSP